MRRSIFYIVLCSIVAVSMWFYFTIGYNDDLAYKHYDFPTQPKHVNDRQWHRWLMRGGSLEPAKVIKARKIVKSKIKKLSTASQFKDAGMDGQWTSLGPNNIGGRVRAIALQPDGDGGENIFIGAVGGGIWKKDSSSNRWIANNDFSPSMAVTSIVVDPGNPNILYASTGEGQAASTMGIPGAGIYKSIDGGDTWNQLSSTNNENFYWVNKLAINPNNGDHLLAVTAHMTKDAGPILPFSGNGKLWESLNAGITWTEVLSQNNILTDVEFGPNPDRRVVSGHGSLKVYNSTTQQYEEKVTGQTGELITYPGRVEVAIAPLNLSYILYALQNTSDANGTSIIYRSIDGGQTWDQMNVTNSIFSSGSFGNYSNTLLVDPVDWKTIYFGGVDLWKSLDGGVTMIKISDWTTYHDYVNQEISENCQLHGDQHIIVPSLSYSNANRKMYVGNDGGIQYSNDISNANDGSASILTGWNNLVDGLKITQFYAGAVSPHTERFAGGTQDNGTLIMQSTGKWKQPFTGDGHQVIFHPSNASIVYANNNYNGLYKSSNGGQSFTKILELGEDEALLISPMALHPANTDLIYLGGKSLWRYNDSNGMITEIKDSLPDLGNTEQFITSIAVQGAANIWLGYSSGRVEYSQNGGSTWSGDITEFNMPNTAITDIDIRPFSPNGTDALISFGGYSQNNIWQHDFVNGQRTWSNKSLDFNMQVNTISHHPKNYDWIYVGTDVGIFSSEDYGQNWSVYPAFESGHTNPLLNIEGPNYLEISDLFWFYSQSDETDHLIAATFGRGLYYSSSVLPTAFVNRQNNLGPMVGSRSHPFQKFLEAMDKAAGKGTNVTFLSAGSHPEIDTPMVFNQKVLISSELTSGFSVIIN